MSRRYIGAGRKHDANDGWLTSERRIRHLYNTQPGPRRQRRAIGRLLLASSAFISARTRPEGAVDLGPGCRCQVDANIQAYDLAAGRSAAPTSGQDTAAAARARR